jgi:hypothetical protein
MAAVSRSQRGRCRCDSRPLEFLPRPAKPARPTLNRRSNPSRRPPRPPPDRGRVIRTPPRSA